MHQASMADNIQHIARIKDRQTMHPTPKSPTHKAPKTPQQQGHKATSSMIIENYYKVVNPHPTPVIVQVKNIQYGTGTGFGGTGKTNMIQRHYSEEDFRKYVPQYFVDVPACRVQDQYFPEPISATSKNGKKIRSIEKNQKPNPIRYIRDRNPNEPIRVNYGLKETSSTQSAENLGARPMPAFARSKFQKSAVNAMNKPNDYFNQRLSTPRTNVLKRENFKIISKLGQGKFGKVFLAKQLNTGFILAMKIIQKKKILKQNLLQQFIRELRIQSYLSHPNIISLYTFFSDETHFYTLMQLGCDGQLYSLISNRKILTEEATSFIVKNLLQAIQYIHGNKVLHRDIKPENIVLVMGNVKICDFGWAVNKMFPGDLRNTFCGTPLYLSPEIIQGNRYDQKVDLWAIGILAFQLYLGCSPFDINDQTDLFKIATETIKFPANREISPQFRQFINSMLTKNPHQRLTSKRLLEMDFITKYREFQTCEELCK